MILTFMGTGASEGVPGAFCQCPDCMEARKLGGRELRSRSQLLVNHDLLIDLGPETYWKSVLYGIELSRVKYLFVTHSHCDHLEERLLGFRGAWFGKEMIEPVLYAYGNEKVAQKINTRLEGCQAVGIKEATCMQAVHPFKVVQTGNYNVTPLPAIHAPGEEALIYLIADTEGKCVLYATDTGKLTEDTYTFLNGEHLNCVIMDCTLGAKTVTDTYHMGLRDNKLIQERLSSMGITDDSTRFLCTHVSHGTGGYRYLAGCAEALGMELAWDGMTVEI